MDERAGRADLLGGGGSFAEVGAIARRPSHRQSPLRNCGSFQSQTRALASTPAGVTFQYWTAVDVAPRPCTNTPHAASSRKTAAARRRGAPRTASQPRYAGIR